MSNPHDDVISLLNAYRFAEAEVLCRQLLRQHVSSIERSNLRCTLAHIIEADSRPAAASRLYHRVLRDLARQPGVAPLRVKCWRGLGRCARVQGRYSEGLAYLRRAVRTARRFPDYPSELSAALGDLGVLLRYQGRLRFAIAAYTEALSIAEAVLGPDCASNAAIHHMLAGACHLLGNLEEAEAWGRRAVAVRSAGLGPDHPDTVADAACLATILIDRGELDEADRLLRHAWKVFRRVYGDVHYENAITLHNLASIAHRRGRLAQARRQFAQSLAMKEQLLGPTHPDLVMTLNNLAVLSPGTQQSAEWINRAVRIAAGAFDPAHPTRQLLEANLARLSPVA